MTNPLTVTAGNRSLDQSVVPYIRAREVAFSASSLLPGSRGYYYFDSTKIDSYIQHASTIVINAQDASKYSIGDGLYCNLTHGYATVLAVSPNSTIYISENYITFNVANYSIETLTDSSYSVGDLVYQSTSNTFASVTFMGSVAYWNNTDKVLSLIPEKGSYGTLTSNTLYAVGKTAKANVTSVVGANKFPTSSYIRSTTTASKTSLVSSYTHKSGILPNTATSTTVIPLGGPTNAAMVSNTFYITSGIGIGQSKQIVSVTANTVTLDSALTVLPTGNTRYSIGNNFVDKKGIIAGIFNIPELPTVKFLTGERIFSITNQPTFADPDVTSSAVAKYVSAGFLNLTDKFQTPTVSPPPPARPAEVVTQVSTVIPDLNRRRDPIAQTFFTPKPKSAKKNYGIFVSSIDLFFSQKPAATAVLCPVEVRIVEVENGIPTEKIIASTFAHWEDVKVSDPPKKSMKTNFKFADPQYLAPDTEYALVIVSDSPDYRVWFATLGGLDRTDGITPAARISQQPYSGSLFFSQNGSTWTPEQQSDLMFSINKAVFSTTSATAYFKVKPKSFPTIIDKILLHSSDIDFPTTSLDYSLRTTYLNSLSYDYGNAIVPNKLFNFGNDLTSSSLTSNRRRVVQAGLADSMLVTVSMSTTDPDISPILNIQRLSAITYANHINAGGIYPQNISVVTRGANHNAATAVVSISAPDLSGGVQAVASVVLSSSNTLSSLNITNSGSGYVNAPTITITDVNATSNATVSCAGENKYRGGNAIARYQTRKITLANGFDASDLRVFVECVRPSGTHVIAYYKVLSAQDDAQFTDRIWVKMDLLNDVNSPDQLTPVELKFAHNVDSYKTPAGKMSYNEEGDTTGENPYPIGGTFKHFAIKLVLLANDPTVSPVVYTMRAITTPAG